MSAGIKVLVLAVIVGIGSAIFTSFQSAVGTEPSIDQALAIVLASLTLMGLGIFGPGIATGLVSGGPQLGAGAAVGTMVGAAGMAMAAGAAVGGAARLAARGGTALGSASSLAAGAREPTSRATPGAPNVGGGPADAATDSKRASSPSSGAEAPQWAQRLHRRSQLAHGVATATHAVRSSDHGGGGASPNLRQGESP